jgi:hypothetical protein
MADNQPPATVFLLPHPDARNVARQPDGIDHLLGDITTCNVQKRRKTDDKHQTAS